MDTELLTPTTRLEAVNEMLAAIGEAPVASLSVEHADVVDAVRKLQVISRAIQSQGWHWNRDEHMVLEPEADTGFVRLPTNTLRVDTTGPNATLDLVERGRRLYNRRTCSYNIGQPVTVDIVTMLNFEDLPEIARRYITMQAVRSFQKDMETVDADFRYTEDDVRMAYADVMAAEVNTSDPNILTDTWDVFQIVHRRI